MTNNLIVDSAWDNYHSMWASKTTKQIQNEAKSWRKYMQRNDSAYNLHGSDMTPPGSLADGGKLTILRDILRERGGQEL